MTSPNRTSRIDNLQAHVLGFPRETIVTGWFSEIEITVDRRQGRLEDPCVLTERMLEEFQRAVRFHIPTRKTKQLAVEIVTVQTCECFVEKDIRVRKQHRLPVEVFVRIIE